MEKEKKKKKRKKHEGKPGRGSLFKMRLDDWRLHRDLRKESAKFSGQITSCLALPWLFLQERQTGEETQREERERETYSVQVDSVVCGTESEGPFQNKRVAPPAPESDEAGGRD